MSVEVLLPTERLLTPDANKLLLLEGRVVGCMFQGSGVEKAYHILLPRLSLIQFASWCYVCRTWEKDAVDDKNGGLLQGRMSYLVASNKT
jgi:hypothetical protein